MDFLYYPLVGWNGFESVECPNYIYFESPFLLRVQRGCNAGDTACTICSVWTKLADFCALYALYARCNTPWTACRLTSNQSVERSNRSGGTFYWRIRHSSWILYSLEDMSTKLKSFLCHKFKSIPHHNFYP
jgi:hypothetical protein